MVRFRFDQTIVIGDNRNFVTIFISFLMTDRSYDSSKRLFIENLCKMQRGRRISSADEVDAKEYITGILTSYFQ